MKLTNLEMLNSLNALNQISDKVYGKLGYAVARNIRKLANELVEFEQIRYDTFYKYATLNENNEYELKANTPAYQEFINEIHEIAMIVHKVDIYKIEPDIVIESELSAKEVNNLVFMIKDKGEE